jgi:hypothetical protein
VGRAFSKRVVPNCEAELDAFSRFGQREALELALAVGLVLVVHAVHAEREAVPAAQLGHLRAPAGVRRNVDAAVDRDDPCNAAAAEHTCAHSGRMEPSLEDKSGQVKSVGMDPCRRADSHGRTHHSTQPPSDRPSPSATSHSQPPFAEDRRFRHSA